jgi:hypothetical protein
MTYANPLDVMATRFAQAFDTHLEIEGLLTKEERRVVRELVEDSRWAAALVILTHPPLWIHVRGAVRYKALWSYLDDEALECARESMASEERTLLEAATSFLTGSDTVSMRALAAVGLPGKQRLAAGINAYRYWMSLRDPVPAKRRWALP